MRGVVVAVSRSATHTLQKAERRCIRLVAGSVWKATRIWARPSSTAPGWRVTPASPICARSI